MPVWRMSVDKNITPGYFEVLRVVTTMTTKSGHCHPRRDGSRADPGCITLGPMRIRTTFSIMYA